MEEKPRERFYLWVESKTSGWTAIGCLTGYESIEKLQRENDFYFEPETKRNIMIMKAIPYS